MPPSVRAVLSSSVRFSTGSDHTPCASRSSLMAFFPSSEQWAIASAHVGHRPCFCRNAIW